VHQQLEQQERQQVHQQQVLLEQQERQQLEQQELVFRPLGRQERHLLFYRKQPEQ
jgi:hypothetical protein